VLPVQTVRLVRQVQQVLQISQWYLWARTNDKENGVVTNGNNIKGTISWCSNNNHNNHPLHGASFNNNCCD
jgi:hypothetical protein